MPIYRNSFSVPEPLELDWMQTLHLQHLLLVAVLNVANNQEPPLMEGEKKDWIKHFRFQQERDSPSDTPSVLLVVAALIANCHIPSRSESS